MAISDFRYLKNGKNQNLNFKFYILVKYILRVCYLYKLKIIIEKSFYVVTANRELIVKFKL